MVIAAAALHFLATLATTSAKAASQLKVLRHFYFTIFAIVGAYIAS